MAFIARGSNRARPPGLPTTLGQRSFSHGKPMTGLVGHRASFACVGSPVLGATRGRSAPGRTLARCRQAGHLHEAVVIDWVNSPLCAAESGSVPDQPVAVEPADRALDNPGPSREPSHLLTPRDHRCDDRLNSTRPDAEIRVPGRGQTGLGAAGRRSVDWPWCRWTGHARRTRPRKADTPDPGPVGRRPSAVSRWGGTAATRA